MDDDSRVPVERGVVAVVVRSERMLVVRRSRWVIAPRTLCFPGGSIESNESEQEALVRELQEELNVAVTPLRRLWHCVTASRVELFWWLTDLAEDAALKPNPAEVESVFWLTPNELVQLPNLLETNRRFLAAIKRGEVALD